MDVARVTRLLGDRGSFGRSLATIVLLAAWVSTWRPQVDPDAWWHIAFGESIAREGSIPRVETFSWLTADDRVIVHSWLWDVLLAGAYRLAGETGTSLLVLPASAAIVVLLWLLVRTVAASSPPLGQAVFVLAAMVAALPAWAPRAQTLDVAFVLATVLVLARYMRHGELRPLVALPVIGLLWANLHGSAILALPAILALALVTQPAAARLGDWPARPVLPVLAAGAAAMVAACVNPYGPGLLLYPTDRAVASAFIPEIVEWRPPDLTAAGLLPFAALLVVAGSVLVPRRGRPDIFILITTGAWTIAALWSARFIAVAACLLVVATAATIEAARYRRVGRGEAPGAPPASQASRALRTMTALASITVLAVGWTLISPGAQDAAISHRLPVAAVDALTAAECRGRLLVDYGWGGYVIWSADLDVGAYGNSAERAVRAQLAVELLTMDPTAWLLAHEVDVVLMPRDGPLSRWLDQAIGWQQRYEDEQATIHIRQDRDDCSIGGQSVATGS